MRPRWGRIAAAALVALAAWGALVLALSPPAYIFPPPWAVAGAFAERPLHLMYHAGVTALQIVLGLAVGVSLGGATALAAEANARLSRTIVPLMVVTQTLPVFAIAPLLVIWLGFGMASKIAMAALIIYFPVATAYAEAMARTDAALVDLARLNGASDWQILWRLRAPAGLPGLAAGLRIGATVAPIGAVVGEWVGASAGLGYVMLHANARLQTDVLFAALALLAAIALVLRALVDRLASRLAPWAAPGGSLALPEPAATAAAR